MMKFTIIIGLGATGYSCVKYCVNKNIPIKVIDTRNEPSNYKKLQANFPNIEVHTGSMHLPWLLAAARLIISPGVSLELTEIQQAIAYGIEITSDVQLFINEISQNNNIPLLAVTGSNGKSTVVRLVEHIIKQTKLIPAVGGNIGIPVLSLLEYKQVDVYILELSSFQLELLNALPTTAAAVLNVSDDHLDRHNNIIEYAKIKNKIYQQSKVAIFNAQDSLTYPKDTICNSKLISFTTEEPNIDQYGIKNVDNQEYLCSLACNYANIKDLKIYGSHNHLNALAAIALCEAININHEHINQGLTSFTGLKHRCQWVARHNNINWFNDSKATNVGATLACLSGINSKITKSITLLAGGDGKNAEFKQLTTIVKQKVKNLIVYGKDSAIIAADLQDCCNIYKAIDLVAAVAIAADITNPAEIVILSPACSSLDMFTNFEHRGQTFMQAVHKVITVNESSNN